MRASSRGRDEIAILVGQGARGPPGGEELALSAMKGPGARMDILVEALQALAVIAGMVVAVLLIPLLFMIVFSLITGFDDHAPHDDYK